MAAQLIVVGPVIFKVCGGNTCPISPLKVMIPVPESRVKISVPEVFPLIVPS